MEIEYHKHIGIYKNVLPKSWCESVIEEYESSPDKYSRFELEKITPLLKKDTHVPVQNFSEKIRDPFIKCLNEFIIPLYNRQYSFNSGQFNLEIVDFKVQKTNPSEGYHMWHYENSQYDFINRLLVYTAYLNDVKKGGETEFLHQAYRAKPKQGTIIIFPASFTHLHRGNPPLSGSKYLITGWIRAKS